MSEITDISILLSEEINHVTFIYKLNFFVSNVAQSTCICMHTMKKQKVNSLEYHVV